MGLCKINHASLCPFKPTPLPSSAGFGNVEPGPATRGSESATALRQHPTRPDATGQARGAWRVWVWHGFCQEGGGVGWIVDCRAAIVSLCSTPPEQFILHEDVSRPCIEISTWGCAPKARSFRFSGTHLLERDRGADRPAGFGAAGFDVRATRVGAREPEHVRAESRAELGVSRDRAEWPRPSAELQKAAELQSLNM